MRLGKIFLILLFLITSHARAETEAERLQEKVKGALEVRQGTQKKEDEWATDKARLEAEYESLVDRKEYLEKEEVKTKETLSVQRGRVLELERKLKESARLKEELNANLDKWVTRLDEWIKQDLLFLSQERGDRLSFLKKAMADPAIQSAERFRRIMEALQVETEYGGTVEIYQEKIDLDGRLVLVDVFRLGRLSLFYQTPDGEQAGYYDRVSGRWKPLPKKYRREINMAVEMAGRRRPIDLIKLPVGRIEP